MLVGQWVDNKKFDRWENQVKIQDRVNSILNERGCDTLRSIPPKLGIPLIDSALLEDDSDLRELWSKLIANSLDSTRDFGLKYVYIDIIKSLTPLDVRALKYIHEYTNKELSDKKGIFTLSDIHEEFKESYEDWFINISITNLMRVRCIQDVRMMESLNDDIINEKSRIINQTFKLTTLGMDFIHACMTD